MKKLTLPEFIVIAVGILLLGFLIISTVYGADGPGQMTIFCTAPTKNTNGTTLTDLTGFRFIADNKIIVNSPSCPYQFSGLTPGLHSFVVRAVTPEAPPDDLSDPAGPITAIVSGAQILSVIDTTAYKQTLQINGYTMNIVGTIPLKTPCVDGKTVDGLNLLPDRTAVTYLCKGVPCKQIIIPTNTFAKCALQ